jgi:putative endonuclease
VYLHREDVLDGFTARYNVHRLVYFEQHDRAIDAITREKRVKKWNREWKNRLVDAFNPEWRDLFEEIAS